MVAKAITLPLALATVLGTGGCGKVYDESGSRF